MVKKERLGRSNPLHSPTAVGNPLAAALDVAQNGPAQRTTFSLSLEVAERARDAAYELRLPVVEVVERAIRTYVEQLERERGVPFLARPRRLKGRRTRRLRMILDFEASGATRLSLDELRGSLARMVQHQDLGTQVGPRDLLESVGFSEVRLVTVELDVAEEAASWRRQA